jgi:hypothetical protein
MEALTGEALKAERKREAKAMRELKATMAKVGGKIKLAYRNRRLCRYLLDSPAGKVWASDNLHCLVLQWELDWSGLEEIADALQRVEHGLDDCDDPECDYCCPEVPAGTCPSCGHRCLGGCDNPGCLNRRDWENNPD